MSGLAVPMQWMSPRLQQAPEVASPVFAGLKNPSAAPNWREIRVKDLIAKPLNKNGISRGPLRSRDDWPVFIYHQFLHGFLTIEDEDDHYAHNAEYPEVFLSHLMRHDSQYERHVQLESRVLARMTPEEISQELHMDVGVIDWYEKLFFDVRDKLDAVGWISQIIHGSVVDRLADQPAAVTPARRGAFMRLMGFCGGPPVLRLLELGLPNFGAPKTGEEVGEWLNRTTQFALSRKSAEAAHFFDVNKYNVIELLNLHCRTLEYNQRDRLANKGIAKEGDDLLALMVPFVKEIRATMDDSVLEMPDLSPNARKYLKTSMEPRAKDWLNMAGEEMMALEASGVSLEDLNGADEEARVKELPIVEFSP